MVLALALAGVATSAAAQGGPVPMPPARTADLVAEYPAVYPEGAVRIGDSVFIADMNVDSVYELSGADLKPYWSEANCGPTSITPLGDDRKVVLCHLGGYLAILDASGNTVAQLRADASGGRIIDPNDSYSDGAGGAYISDAGVFSPFAEATGSVLHLTADLKVFRVARGIRYANGVSFHAPSRTLLVSEHLGHRILRFPVLADGNLGEPAVLIDLNRVEGLINTPLSGPDGIEFIDDDSFLVAIYGEGRFLHISLAGNLIETLPVRPQWVTNVTGYEGNLVIVGAYTIDRPVNTGTIDVLHW